MFLTKCLLFLLSGCSIVGRNFTFDGSLFVKFIPTGLTSNITLHGVNLNIDYSSIVVRDVDGFKVSIAQNGLSYNSAVQQFTILMNQSFVPELYYSLELKYTGLINDYRTEGLFYTKYISNGQTKYIIATTFESIQARRMVPCWDEPAYKAVFQISVIHPVNTVALSNGLEQHLNKTNNSDWVRTDFKPTQRMSTYLLAITVGELVPYSTKNQRGTLVRAWAWPDMAAYLQSPMNVAAKSLDFFGNYFNSPFPLEKADIVALPQFDGGAMENWGLVIFHYKRMIFNPQNQPIWEQLEANLVIAHELAHQWFGDLVTMIWWNDLFLNEGSADYWEYAAIKHIFPSQQLSLVEIFGRDQDEFGMEVDERPGQSHPVVYKYGPRFDWITYRKGSSLFHMLNYTLGSSVFQQGLQKYLAHYKYTNANHENLWSALTSVATSLNVTDWSLNSTLNVSTFMDPWVMQDDFPLLTVQRNIEEGWVKVSQRPFSIPLPNVTANSSQWYIPMWYTRGSSLGQTFVKWILPNSTTTILGLKPDEWIGINPNVRTFCRVNYDPISWRLIQQQLVINPFVFDSAWRSQLLWDSRYFVSAGLHDYTLFLGLTQYLASEKAYTPWNAVEHPFLKFRQMFAAHSGTNQMLHKYMYSLVVPAYTSFTPGNNSADQLLRALLLDGCLVAQNSACITKASTMFQNMLTNCQQSTNGSTSCSTIPPELRKAVYCAGIEHGSFQQWMALHNLYQEERRTQLYWTKEAEQLLYGLSCTKNPNLLNLYISMAFSGKLSLPAAFEHLDLNLNASATMWSYLQSNNTTAAQSRWSSRFVQAMTKTWNTADKVTNLENFMTAQPANSGLLAALRNGIRWVHDNIVWMETHSLPVTNWLGANA